MKPDLNAPRYRRSAEGTLNKPFLAALREAVPQARGFSDAELKDFIVAFNTQLWQTAIDERDGVELPESLGHLFIGTCPGKRRSANVDYKKSAEYLQLVQHRNWESDDFLCKIFYTNHSTRYRFRHHELWGFTAAREFRRSASRAYPEKWKQYVEVDPRVKISALFRSAQYKHYKQKETERLLQDYNELDL
jgi:hypothetical protein